MPPPADQETTSATGDAITAGWYQDPVDPGLLRWWDGAAWTDQTHRKA